jgi:hypothetical protein
VFWLLRVYCCTNCPHLVHFAALCFGRGKPPLRFFGQRFTRAPRRCYCPQIIQQFETLLTLRLRCYLHGTSRLSILRTALLRIVKQFAGNMRERRILR